MKDIVVKNKFPTLKRVLDDHKSIKTTFKPKATNNRIVYFIFSLMTTSVLVYLFFITSTIFFAINTQKHVSKIKNLANQKIMVEANPHVTEILNKGLVEIEKEKISFINKNTDIAISLK